MKPRYTQTQTVTVTCKDASGLWPLMRSARVLTQHLKRGDIALDDLRKMLLLERCQSHPRKDIMRRILGKIHTQERNHINQLCQ